MSTHVVLQGMDNLQNFIIKYYILDNNTNNYDANNTGTSVANLFCNEANQVKSIAYGKIAA